MVNNQVSWAELDDAYGEASGVPALLQGMLEGDESATFELAARLVHQGWRYSATLASLRCLIDRCMMDGRLIERCIEPILLFATGDLADFFPHAAMHHDACPAIAAAAERYLQRSRWMPLGHAVRSFQD